LHLTIEALQQIWKAYLNAYGDVAADERERLLRQSVTDDVVFTGPNEDDRGFGKLVEHIERRNLISNRFRTFLEGTKPFFVRFQESAACTRSKKEEKPADLRLFRDDTTAIRSRLYQPSVRPARSCGTLCFPYQNPLRYKGQDFRLEIAAERLESKL
jgi:hypothetical protein